MEVKIDNLDLAYLRLKNAKGLGPRKAKLLIEHFGSVLQVLAADKIALAELEGVGPSLIKAINDAKTTDWPEQELARIKQKGFKLLNFEAESYPTSLKAIFDPPMLLYINGKLPELNTAPAKAIGIVGARDASDYALSFSSQLAKSLAEANIVIVSGLALGIDGSAHRGAMEATDGRTIAVLGSGLDNIYPSTHKNMATKIAAKHGAVISEYPLGTRPNASNFPGRNRIINGLSAGIVVVEAAKKSGSLITADYAAEEGRTVFAVPGRVGELRSEGTLGLLKQGAILIDSAEDVFNEFSWAAKPREIKALNLSEGEEAVLELIRKLANPLLDNLAEALNLPAAQIMPILTMLELKGLIKAQAGGRYIVLPQ